MTLLLPLALASPLAKRSSGGRIAPLKEEGESIEDSYIVVLRKDVDPAMMALHLGSVEESNGLDVSGVSYLALRRGGGVRESQRERKLSDGGGRLEQVDDYGHTSACAAIGPLRPLSRLSCPCCWISADSQPLFTFTSEGEKVDESGVTHVYMPSGNLTYFGYGK